jgi:hypothetical protein
MDYKLKINDQTFDIDIQSRIRCTFPIKDVFDETTGVVTQEHDKTKLPLWNTLIVFSDNNLGLGVETERTVENVIIENDKVQFIINTLNIVYLGHFSNRLEYEFKMCGVIVIVK